MRADGLRTAVARRIFVREVYSSMCRSTISLALTMVVVVGCATPATEPLRFVAETRNDGSADTSKACVVYVRSVDDVRNPASTFGSYSNLDLFAQTVPSWVRSALVSLDGPKRKVVLAQTDSRDTTADSLVMFVRIHKAYVERLASSKTAHIVLSSRFERHGKTLATEFYRGSDTSVSWTGSADEVENAMNSAMNSILGPIRMDMERYCADRTSIY
jgi:hypothetical protein